MEMEQDDNKAQKKQDLVEAQVETRQDYEEAGPEPLSHRGWWGWPEGEKGLEAVRPQDLFLGHRHVPECDVFLGVKALGPNVTTENTSFC